MLRNGSHRRKISIADDQQRRATAVKHTVNTLLTHCQLSREEEEKVPNDATSCQSRLATTTSEQHANNMSVANSRIKAH